MTVNPYDRHPMVLTFAETEGMDKDAIELYSSRLQLARDAIEFRRTVIDDHMKDSSNWATNTVSIGEVYGSSVSMTIDTLRRIQRTRPGEPVRLEINSPGGSVIDGFALYDVLQELRAAGHHVTTVTYGYAASMGGVLLQAGDVRAASPNAWVMVHELSHGTIGKVSEMKDSVATDERMYSQLLDILASRSHMTKDEIWSKADRRDWWMDSAEALEHGFIDRIEYPGAGLERAA